jgi:hypothetical protein
MRIRLEKLRLLLRDFPDQNRFSSIA